MSIFDKKLFNTLYRIAQAAELPNQAAILDTARKLVNNLQAELAPKNDLVQSSNPDTDLNYQNITSLDNLLRFLNDNGVRVSSDLVCIEHQAEAPGLQSFKGNLVFAQLPPAKQKEYFNFPGNAGNDFKYWVNKDKLIKYLQDLFNKVSVMKNELLIATVKRLIDAANSALNVQIPLTAPESGEVGVLDSIPRLLNPGNPSEAGPIKLKIENLASKSAFFTFVSANKLQFNTGAATDLADKFDANLLCMVVNYLYNRVAPRHAARGSEIDTQYLKAVEALVSQYDGCTLTNDYFKRKDNDGGANPSPIVGLAIFDDKGNITDEGKAFTESDRIYPLERASISFEKISAFLVHCKKLSYLKDGAEIANIERSMSDVKKTYPEFANSIAFGGMTGERLVQKVAAMTKNNSGGQILTAKPLILTLQDIVEQCHNILATILSHENIGKGGASGAYKSLANIIGEQNDCYSENVNYLERWSAENDEYIRKLNSR